MIRSARALWRFLSSDRVSAGGWRHGRKGRLVAITSGKGGTGKTFLTTNLAVALARKRRSVAIVDADLGLANAHLLLGMSPRFNLSHVLHDRMSLEDVAETGPHGVRLISGGSGISELAALDDGRLLLITRQIDRLRASYDWIFIDTSAGIGPQTLVFLYATREVILVTTPDVTALTDAYAVLKTLHLRDSGCQVSFVVNRVTSEVEAEAAFDRVARVARRFLDREIQCLGRISQDPQVGASVAAKNPLVTASPRSPAARDLDRVVRSLRQSRAPAETEGALLLAR